MFLRRLLPGPSSIYALSPTIFAEGRLRQGNGPPPGVYTFDPWHPAASVISTMISLLSLSGCTVTWAHHSLLHGDPQGPRGGPRLHDRARPRFTGIQAYEYFDRALSVSSTAGSIPSTFFLATGFHGFPRHRWDDLPDSSAWSAP
ncbi:cytochrome c oxidase subunit 3 [Elioraea tepida]|uniref:cytochrome c oxidase subunit 3 n=1 Tax=Elioraea tepida TaxID=2843330 RepID=UPI0022A7315C|nr:cytochrome c oxidase subunit 3 [Elioraea tepida]